MAGPVMVRPLSEGEDRELLRVVRGVGRQDAVRLRRALIVRASADGIAAPLIARVLDADADHVRDVIHEFNANGLTALNPHWGPGPRRRITPTDEAYTCRWPQPARRRWASRSRTGACASWPII